MQCKERRKFQHTLHSVARKRCYALGQKDAGAAKSLQRNKKTDTVQVCLAVHNACDAVVIRSTARVAVNNALSEYSAI